MDNVFVKVGPITIYWYSILILVAVLVGFFIVYKEAIRRNIDNSFITDLFFYLIPISIIGARIYYVIFNFKVYQDDLLGIFKIWEGGLAIYGAIISSLIFIYFYAKKNKKDFLTILDIFAPALILGQAIGRWGNFFNKEAYGVATTYSHLKKLHIPEFIIHNMYINGSYYTPTFLYESLWCLLGFIILIILRGRQRNKKGRQLAIYCIFYGVGRFLIEGLRMDSLYLGMFRISQIISIIFIVIGFIVIILGILKNDDKKKEDSKLNSSIK